MELSDRRDIEEFMANVRASVFVQSSGLREYFDIYANEAIFGLSIIKEDVSVLPREATVLEVGAGALLLSGYLASLGLRVYALEPITAGFSHFHELQSAVVKHYESVGLQVRLVESTIENFVDSERFDYIFSINVFEHIHDIDQAFANAYLSLKHRGALRVYCPNYHFPYEPHFNIPTLINKRLTGYFFRNLIEASSRMPQPKETWEGLNWINASRVNKFLHSRFGNRPIFNRLATYWIIVRVLNDSQFSERRPKWATWFLWAINRVGLLNLFKLWPVKFSPVMDFRFERVAVKG